MPSSSSAKKVARVAARSGSGSPAAAGASKQRNWLFFLAIFAILVLGAGVVVFARNTNNDRTKNTTKPRASIEAGKPFDHWHAAFAMNVCGKELPPLAQPATDPLGIHTHADGLIHIHPFTINAAGKKATMAKFWDLTKLQVTDKGFKDPATGKVYEEGKTTCGGKPTQLVMAYWKDGTASPTNPPDKIYTSNFPSVNFTNDLAAYTLALLPKGDKNIPAPSTAADVATLGACDGENPPASCNATTQGSTIPDGGNSTGTTPATSDTSGNGG